MCRNWLAFCSSGTLPATSSSSAPRMVCSESRNSSEEAARISAVLRVRSPPASGAPAAGRRRAVGPLGGAFQILVQHLLAVAPVAARGAERDQQPLLLDPVERAQADAQVFHRVAGVEERVAAPPGRQCGSLAPPRDAPVVPTCHR